MFHNRIKHGLAIISALFVIALLAPPGLWAAPLQKKEVTPPHVGARAAILVEYPSGRVLYQKGVHQRLAPASTTKILTAILALENGKLDDVVTVSRDDMIHGSSMGLRVGEKQTLRNLLYGLMLPSGNDAALTIARHIGSQSVAQDPIGHFVGMMNARVEQLGLKNTYFSNPHGLSRRWQQHYSSAYDLASLTWHAMQLDTFNEIVRHPQYDVPGHRLVNINKMVVNYPGADGVKTGYTRAAGLCLVTSATRNGKRLVSVVLNAPRWYDDSTALLNYGFAELAASPKSSGGERLRIATP